MFDNFDWSKWLTTSVIGLLILAVTAAFTYDLLKVIGRQLSKLVSWLALSAFGTIVTGILAYISRPLISGRLFAEKCKKEGTPDKLLVCSLFLCTKLLAEILILNLVIFVVWNNTHSARHDTFAVLSWLILFVIVNMGIKDLLFINGAMKPYFGADLAQIREQTKTIGHPSRHSQTR